MFEWICAVGTSLLLSFNFFPGRFDCNSAEDWLNSGETCESYVGSRYRNFIVKFINENVHGKNFTKNEFMAELYNEFESKFFEDSYEEFLKDEFVSAFLNHMKISPNVQFTASLSDV